MKPVIDFRTEPDRYRHWRLRVEPPIAWLEMNVDERGGLAPGYELKLNSYDLGVDIELHDAVQRLRFEHPEVHAVVLTSLKERVFCAGANIRMLGQSTHAHKVNFCKFTNETRNALEEAGAESGQRYLAAINGTAAGGGYELALACDHILLVDDGNAAVSLPEVPLLAVLPGTGGLTRVTDKRKVRRDRADVFCTLEEGVRGQRAVDWRLVDELAPTSRFAEATRERALAMAAESDRPADAEGVRLERIERELDDAGLRYPGLLEVSFDRAHRLARFTLHGPRDDAPESVAAMHALGARWWPLAFARAFDDAMLHLRVNEPELGTWVLTTDGDAERVLAHDAFLAAHQDDWLAREVRLLWRRTLKRLDLSARSLYALIEPGSCFAGLLAEVALAADRGYMLEGTLEGDPRPPAAMVLSAFNFAGLEAANGLSRLATRLLGEPQTLEAARARIGEPLAAAQAVELGLVTFAFDDIDWEDEVRIALEERASFSPDALTGLEANLRFAGPETMETKIFGRLTAWQNWIFQRPNAAGDEGALRAYGTGARPAYDFNRT